MSETKAKKDKKEHTNIVERFNDVEIGLSILKNVCIHGANTLQSRPSLIVEEKEAKKNTEYRTIIKINNFKI